MEQNHVEEIARRIRTDFVGTPGLHLTFWAGTAALAAAGRGLVRNSHGLRYDPERIDRSGISPAHSAWPVPAFSSRVAPGRGITHAGLNRRDGMALIPDASVQGRATRMSTRKRVALIAHDNCKGEILDWARLNRGTLIGHELHAAGTTGALPAAELGLPVTRFLSGPLGGDQQVGAAIVEGSIDFVIFFWDPLEPQPHDVDVKALLRVAVVHNVPIACNRATADFLLSSPLMHREYERLLARSDRREAELQR
jgi:methylglyoxal synthase